jgi:pimeloyl-ACP methyl ester carboxylesterase
MSAEQSVQNPTATTVQIPAPTQFYEWRGYRCAYEVQGSPTEHENSTPIVLIHPIGVGLSRRFWDRFSRQWFESEPRNLIYSPDLLGCGESDMPRAAYRPEDWAEQLRFFVTTIVSRPAIFIVQGALFPVAIALTQMQQADETIKGLILAGPPAWAVMTRPAALWQQRLSWSLFDSPIGKAFYRYARRRQFLASFSDKQLFAESEKVDESWLNMLVAGAQKLESRYAVFSFLAGFWRRDYEQAIAQIQAPTLVVIGKTASSISRSGQGERPEQRMADYLQRLPHGDGKLIPGRNVLPYEATAEFIGAIAPFVQDVSHR